MVSKDDATTQQELKTLKKPFEVYEDTEIDQDPYGSYKDTQSLQQRGPSDYGDDPDLDKKMDKYDADGMGIFEKFESKAQQGLFWARCNKCKTDDCKWCKMAKEFSKSTSKKQYKKMPEKKHPEKTVNYKKKKTNEEFTMDKYFNKLSSVVTGQYGKQVNKSLRPTFENIDENKIEKLIQESFMPTMTKKGLMQLIEREIKKKSKLSERTKSITKDDTKEKEKIAPPKEKEKTPGKENPFKPKPGVNPKPKADTKEKEKIAPPKEKEKTPGKENPFKPKPGVNPKPKAMKKDVPNWLSFDSLTDNI